MNCLKLQIFILSLDIVAVRKSVCLGLARRVLFSEQASYNFVALELIQDSCPTTFWRECVKTGL